MASIVGMCAYLASDHSLGAVRRTFREGLFRPPPFLATEKETHRRAGLGLASLFAFDAPFFKVLPADATIMDPQQRKLVECVVDCFTDAGVAHDQIRSKTEIGCYIGCGVANYLTAAGVEPPTFFSEETRRFIGNDLGCLALRTAYLADLTGPAFSVQSTCSSGLLAVHLAAQQVDCGGVDLAIAAGCNIDHLSGHFRGEEGGIISPTGNCRPLSAVADGTFFSNGICAFLIASDEAIMRFGLIPYARVLASGANNDGRRKAGFTAPSIDGQASLIEQVIRRASLRRSPDIVELHGTGTKVGDPIELAALEKAYSSVEGPQVLVSSGKSNYGHLNAAAGALGLFRLIMSVDERMAFSSVGCVPLNTEIQWARSRMRPAIHSLPLTVDKPIGAVSSFGIGGTNVHMLLEAGPNFSIPSFSIGAIPVLIGSHAAELLDDQAQKVVDAFAACEQIDPDAVAYTCRRLFANKPHLSLLVIDPTAKTGIWHEKLGDLRLVTGGDVDRHELSISDWKAVSGTPELLISRSSQEPSLFEVPSGPEFARLLKIALIADYQQPRPVMAMRGIRTAFRQNEYVHIAYANRFAMPIIKP